MVKKPLECIRRDIEAVKGHDRCGQKGSHPLGHDCIWQKGMVHGMLGPVLWQNVAVAECGCMSHGLIPWKLIHLKQFGRQIERPAQVPIGIKEDAHHIYIWRTTRPKGQCQHWLTKCQVRPSRGMDVWSSLHWPSMVSPDQSNQLSPLPGPSIDQFPPSKSLDLHIFIRPEFNTNPSRSLMIQTRIQFRRVPQETDLYYQTMTKAYYSNISQEIKSPSISYDTKKQVLQRKEITIMSL